MKYFIEIMKESIIIIILTTIIGLLSGSFLSANENILFLFPVILLILPSLNDTIGDITTILISRLTNKLYLGLINPEIKKSNALKKELITLLTFLILSVIFILILGYIMAIASKIIIINPFLIIFIFFITSIILFLTLFPILFIFSVVLFKRGKDPNNYLIPLTTTLSDFLTPFLIILFIIILT